MDHSDAWNTTFCAESHCKAERKAAVALTKWRPTHVNPRKIARFSAVIWSTILLACVYIVNVIAIPAEAQTAPARATEDDSPATSWGALKALGVEIQPGA